MVKADGPARRRRTPSQVEMLGNAVLPFFDQDGVHEIYRAWRQCWTPTRASGSASPRRGRPPPERLASYVAPGRAAPGVQLRLPDGAAGAPTACRAVIDDSLAAAGAGRRADAPGCCPTTTSQRHVTRYGGGERRPAPGARRGPADARAARLGLRLPGRGARPAGGPRPAGRSSCLDPQSGCATRPRAATAAGCRSRGPASEPPFGFGPPGSTESWLPPPGVLARPARVEAQPGDPASTLELYRAALRLSAAAAGARRRTALAWLDAPRASLAFRRGDGFVCTVNLTAEPVELPAPGRILLAQREPVARGDAPGAGPIAGGDLVRLAPDSAVWWERR